MMQCYDTLREDYAKIEESESNQMKDDISYEENRLTEETISIFSKMQTNSNDSDHEEFYIQSYSDDSDYANTDTDDEAEERKRLAETDNVSKALVERQYQTIKRLRLRTENFKNRLNKLQTINNLHEIYTEANKNLLVQHSKAVQIAKNIDDETYKTLVLWDREADMSLTFLKPNLNPAFKMDLDFLSSPKIKEEIEIKLAKIKAIGKQCKPELWMYFYSGASRSVISTNSPIRRHLKEITPATGSCSVGNGTPLQYIEKGTIEESLESQLSKI